jgi:hypothetical protein
MRRVAAIEFDPCPHSKTGHWFVVEQVLRDPAALAASVPRVTKSSETQVHAAATGCREPP